MKCENACEIILSHLWEIMIIFDCKGMILTANRTAAEELGYGDGMSGLSAAAVLIKEFEGNDDWETVTERIAGKKQVVCYRKNGTCFRAKSRIFYQKEEERYYFFALNIEENRELVHEVDIARQTAQQAMGVRNHFVANITHELRTPVNGIKGHVENLKTTSLTIEQRRAMEIIESCCDNMSAIIDNILDFSKLEAGKIELEEEQFEIRETIDKMAASHMAAVNEKGLRLSVNVDENIPRFVRGDELRLTQILNNLVSNAVKFTSVGYIKIAVTQTLRINDEIELFFMVADSGIGISREDQDKLFQSFTQVDSSITRRYGGTGLGLVITKELIELMKGKIYLESKKGRGSNFSFSVRMRTVENDAKVLEYRREVTEFMKDIGEGEESAGAEEYYRFGSEQNRSEIESQMEKLVLCIELNAWEKAELWLEELKRLAENADEEIKRALLRLGLTIRKENYEASIKNFGNLKRLLEKKNEGNRSGT